MLPLFWAGCARPAPPAGPPPDAAPAGVTANSGGDTRGTILYRPSPKPAAPPANAYAAVSDRFVIGQRQAMARALAEIDARAHAEAARRFPVPEPGTPHYSKPFASVRAQQQAQLNAHLLEVYQARFCHQYGLSYEQLILIMREARDKHWPLPPPA